MPEKGPRRLQTTIAGLRLCNAAQNELISNLEEYQRRVLGVGGEDDSRPAGYQGSYVAEIGYLQSRREAIDALIAAVERYNELSESLISETVEELVAE
jgi:hypothetical protein